MIKVANEAYIKKVLFNHLDPYRPVIQDLLKMIEQFMFRDRYIKYLRALIAEELPENLPANIYIRRSLIRVKPSFRPIYYNFIAKAHEFMIPEQFINFSKHLHNSNFSYL